MPLLPLARWTTRWGSSRWYQTGARRGGRHGSWVTIVRMIYPVWDRRKRREPLTIDQTKIGEVAAQLMDQLEETFGDDETVEIDSVMLIVSVKHGLFDGAHVRWHNSPDLPIHEALGLLRFVEVEVEDYMRGQPGGEDGT